MKNLRDKYKDKDKQIAATFSSDRGLSSVIIFMLL
jgi:hypothetical protein